MELTAEEIIECLKKPMMEESYLVIRIENTTLDLVYKLFKKTIDPDEFLNQVHY